MVGEEDGWNNGWARRAGPALDVEKLEVAAMALGGRALPVTPGRIIAPGRAPRIVRRAPADGDVVRGVLSVQYADESGGTGIDPAQTSITVNGVDYTKRARITPYTLQIRASALQRDAV